MIQRGNATYQTLILEALSATVENYAVDLFDVVNKGYLDSRLSSVNVADVGGGIGLAAGENNIRTLSAGPGIALLSSAQVVTISSNVVSATTIGSPSSVPVFDSNLNGTLRFKSLSSGYGIHVADVSGTDIAISIGYEKTEVVTLSTPGTFEVSIPANVYAVYFETVGGGGGGGGGGHGGGNSGYGGGGGGGGAYTTLTLSGSQVLSLTSLSATVATGGTGGPGGTNSGSSPGTTGSTGGTTSISTGSTILSAVGGAGGVGGQYSEGSGGSGGGAGGNPNGGDGGNGAYSTGSVFPAANGESTFTPGGGGGGGVIGGGNYAAANGGTGSVVSGSIGGNGAGPSGTGANGALGGGGGGGGGTPYTFPGAGGNGGNGFVRITFYIREGEYKNAGNGVQLLNEPLHEIRTLSAAGGTTLISSSDVITISSTSETITATNVGSGQGVFKQKTGSTLEFRSLSAGPNVSIQPIGDTLVFDVSGSIVNIGLGTQLAVDNTNQLRTLSAVGSIALISGADVITLSGGGGGGGGTIDNIGTGTELGVEGTNQLRTISAGHGIELLSSSDLITISTPTNVGYVVGDSWSYYDPNKPPAVSATQDDEFTGVSALDVKWTTFNSTTAYSTSFIYNHYRISYAYPSPAGEAIQGITQNVQSLSGSAYTIWTKVNVACDAATNRGAGIMVTQSATQNTTEIVTFGIEYTNGARAIVARRYNNYTSLSAAIVGYLPMSGDPKTSTGYLGITVAPTYWKFVFSEDGLDYIPVTNITVVPWTPVLAGLYWHSSSDTANGTTTAYFKFFRRQTGQTNSPGGGMRTVGNGLIYSNTGGGVEILNPSTVNLKTLSAAGSVSLLSGTDVITISGSGGAVANIGAGTQIGVEGTNQFRTLSAVGSLVLLSSADVLTLSAGGGGGGGGGGFGEAVQVYDINGNIVEVGSIVPRDPDPRFLWLFT
jgi:hypothetical protein